MDLHLYAPYMSPWLGQEGSFTFTCKLESTYPHRLSSLPSALYNSYRRSFAGVKLPFRAEVKNAWIYTSTPSISLHGLDRKETLLLLVSLKARIHCK